jgi:hypothetical protein
MLGLECKYDQPSIRRVTGILPDGSAGGAGKKGAWSEASLTTSGPYAFIQIRTHWSCGSALLPVQRLSSKFEGAVLSMSICL